MEDLETLGTVPGCVILSIGMAAFCPATCVVDDGFYTVVGVRSQTKLGLRISADTEAWWAKQSEEAAEVLKLAHAPQAPTIYEALELRNEYIRKFQGSGGVRVWGNGADFDNAIMAALYHAAGMKAAQGPYQGRCYRTVKNMAKGVKMERGGTHHNALDDAKSQARHLISIVQRSGFTLA